MGFGTCYMQLFALRNRSSIGPSLENIQNTQLLMFWNSKSYFFTYGHNSALLAPTELNICMRGRFDMLNSFVFMVF